MNTDEDRPRQYDAGKVQTLSPVEVMKAWSAGHLDDYNASVQASVEARDQRLKAQGLLPAPDHERRAALAAQAQKAAEDGRRYGTCPTQPGQLGRRELQAMTPEQVLAAYEDGSLNEITGRQ